MTRRRLLLIAGGLLALNSGYLLAAGAASLFHAAQILLHPVLGLAALKLTLWAWRSSVAPALRADPLRPLWLLSGGLLAGTGIALLLFGSTPVTRPLLWAHLAAAAGLTALLARRRLLLAPLLAAASIAAGGLLGDFLPAPGPLLNAGLPPATMAGEAMGGADGPFFPSAAATGHGGLIPEDFFLESETCGRCHADITEQWSESAHRFASFNNPWYRRSVEYMQSVVGVTPSKWCAGCHDHAVLFSGLMDRPLAEIVDTEAASAGLACVSCHAVTRVRNTAGNAGFVIEYPEMHDLAASGEPLLRALHDLVLHLDPEPHRQAFLKPLHTGDSSAFCSTCHKVHLDEPVNDYRWLRGFNSYDNWQASGVSGEGARSFYYPAEPRTCADCHMPAVAGEDPAAPDGLVRSHRFAAANTALPTHFGMDTQLQAVRDFLAAGQVTVDLFALTRDDESPGAGEPTPAGADPLALASTFAVGEEAAAAPSRYAPAGSPGTLTAPLDEAGEILRPGETVRVDVVVRTRNLGHFFPSGTVDAHDVWLEFRADDRDGRPFFWSGFLGDGDAPADPGADQAAESGTGGSGTGGSATDAPVEPSAHFFRSLLLDARGNPIDKRNAWAARSALYISQIPPGAAHTVRYRLRVPEEVRGPVTLTARLHYRKFRWWHTQWAFRGRAEAPTPATVAAAYDDRDWRFAEGVAAPVVPVVEMASATVVLPTEESGAGPAAPESPAEDGAEDGARDEDAGSALAQALRFNDYGIGMLLAGDLRAAEAAFAEVARRAPGYADAFVNQARVRVQEGDPEGALAVLDRAFALDPSLPRARFFAAMALKALGRYDEAEEHLRGVLAAFPRDRVANNQLGRLHFLRREFAAAVEIFEATLRIDPEDLEAHYNLMLSSQGLGDADRAARHRALYLRFKADESAEFLTGAYRRAHPDDNNERLPIHEHRNALRAPGTGPSDAGTP